MFAPEIAYESLEELIQNVQSFAMQQGYVVTIKRSVTKTGQLFLKCDQRGKYTPHASKRVNTGTRLCECPFELYSGRQKDNKWHLRVMNANHNHEPSKDMSCHSIARRLSESQKETVRQITAAGVLMITTFINSYLIQDIK